MLQVTINPRDTIGSFYRATIITYTAVMLFVIYIPAWLETPDARHVMITPFQDLYMILHAATAIYAMQLYARTWNNPATKPLDRQRWTAVFWFATGILGFMVGLLWYTIIQLFITGENLYAPSTVYGQDIGFVMLPLAWLVGMHYLMKYWGASLLAEISGQKLISVTALLAYFGASTLLSLAMQGWQLTDTESMIVFGLDTLYGVIDGLIIVACLAILRWFTRQELTAGQRLLVVMILFGWLCMVSGDLAIIYTTQLPPDDPLAYYDGSFNDFIFLASVSALTFGVSLLWHPLSWPEEKRPAWDELTEDEQRLITMLCRGLSNRQMAEILDRSPDTVEKRLTRLYARLGLRNTGQLSASEAGSQRFRQAVIDAYAEDVQALEIEAQGA